MRIRLRILPVTIAVAALIFSVKVVNLVGSTDAGWFSLAPKPLLAQQNDEATEEAPAADGGGEAAPEDTAALVDEGDDAIDEEDEAEPLLDAEEFLGNSTQDVEAAAISPAELEVLQSLRKRRRALDDREANLQLREQMQRAAEHTLESRIEDLKMLKAEVEDLLRKFDEERENELRTLALYYEKMKAKDAARVFNALELTYLIDIVQRMKDAKVAEIIGKMNTLKAKDLTTELVRRRTLPDVDDQLGQAS